MLVYKSVAVKESGPNYAEVLTCLNQFRFELKYRGIFNDVNLLWQEGEFSIFIQRSEGDAEDISPDLVDEMEEQGQKIIEEMTSRPAHEVLTNLVRMRMDSLKKA
jgi:hypothetical protein